MPGLELPPTRRTIIVENLNHASAQAVRIHGLLTGDLHRTGDATFQKLKTPRLE